MKKIWIFLVGLLMLTACSDDSPQMPEPEVKGRTMLAYLIANNGGSDLDKYLKYNLVDMYKGLVGSHEKRTLLVYYRPKPGDISLAGPSILEFTTDGKGKINGQTPIEPDRIEIDDSFSNAVLAADLVIQQAKITPSTMTDEVATDPTVMTANLKKMIQLAPSASYGLAMGSHGTGWLKAYKTTSRSFGDDHGYSMDIPQLAASLKAAFANQKLDFLLFDACMMANAEVAYELRDVTNYMIASALETQVYGFPYQRFFDELYNEKINFQEICDQFVEFSRLKDGWATCSVTDCKQMQTLADWVKKNLAAHADGLNAELPSKVAQFGRRGAGFGDFSFDIVDLFRQLTNSEPTELKALMNKVVVAKNCIESDGREFPYVPISSDRFCGIGMYLPYLVDKPDWNTFYMLSFAWPKAINWTYK